MKKSEALCLALSYAANAESALYKDIIDVFVFAVVW